uniref:Cyclin-dependent kinase inhibitor domain-containing protein n=1 Tax=Glossina brevipalpis TaxID=37001 RepID=A0A1A9W5Z4_9MUSC
MTASSVEFFPCRVQLMGLPRSTATATASSGDLPTALVQRNTANATETNAVTYRRPPLAKVQGVSRNLFGSPKPGEINQLFQKEAQRQRSYVLQRYNFDIASGKPTAKQQQHPTAAVVKANTNSNERHLVTQMPSLIEQELQQHEQRLQKEKCSLNRSAPDEIKCGNFKQKATTNLSSGLKVLRNRTINPSITCQDSTLPSAAAGASLLLSSSERYKPYSRQTLITANSRQKYHFAYIRNTCFFVYIRNFEMIKQTNTKSLHMEDQLKKRRNARKFKSIDVLLNVHVCRFLRSLEERYQPERFAIAHVELSGASPLIFVLSLMMTKGRKGVNNTIATTIVRLLFCFEKITFLLTYVLIASK